MATYSAQMQGKVQKLRRKYRDANDNVNTALLNNIVWYSFPTVYGSVLSVMRDAQRKIDNVKRKRARYRSYVRGMVATFLNASFLNGYKNYNLYLISLTYSDEYYFTTSRASKNDYARKFLNSVCSDYFACLDIGKEHKREHHHAILVTDKPLEVAYVNKKGKTFYKFADAENQWKYGFYSLREINTDKQDMYKTLNYALKSSDYAFKSADESTDIKPFHKRGVVHISEPAL